MPSIRTSLSDGVVLMSPTNYNNLKTEITSHLIDSGLTFSTENGDPVVIRPMKAEVLLDSLLDYMIGAGYATTTRLT